MRPPLSLLVTTLLLVGCDAQEPLGPGGETAVFRASSGPSGLTATALSFNQVSLAWQDNSPNESGFELQASTTGAEGVFTPIASVGANVTSYTAGAAAATQYCFKVRSFTTRGRTRYSAFSNAACATTPAPPPPAAASGVSAMPAGSTSAGISWTDNSWDEAGFRVERSLDQGTSWAEAGTAAANQTWLNDAGRSSEVEVCYRVIAFSVSGDANPSNVDCTTPPMAPTNLVMTQVDEWTIQVSWQDNSAVEEGYELWVSYEVCGYYYYSCWYEYYSVSLPPDATSWFIGTSEYFSGVAAQKDGGYSDWLYASGAASAASAPGSSTSARSRNGR